MKSNQREDFFGIADNKVWLDLGKGVQRKVLAYSRELMLVKVRFEAGAIGEMHQHIHVQTSYVASGKFRFRIADTIQLLCAGDACVVPSNLLHGCECLEAGELIDSFTPYRAEFV